MSDSHFQELGKHLTNEKFGFLVSDVSTESSDNNWIYTRGHSNLVTTVRGRLVKDKRFIGSFELKYPGVGVPIELNGNELPEPKAGHTINNPDCETSTTGWPKPEADSEGAPS